MLTPITPHLIHTNGVAECSLVTIDRSPKCVKELCTMPVYSEIDFPRLLERQTPHRLMLLCEDEFFPLQLAAFLAAHRSSTSKALIVVPPSALVREKTTQPEPPLEPQESLLACGKPILIIAPTGAVFTPEVEKELTLYLDNASAASSDVFVALRPSQIDSGKVEELMFRHHFEVAHIHAPTLEHLSNLLLSFLKSNTVSLADGLNATAVVAAIRQKRGMTFSPADLYMAVTRAVQNSCKAALTLDDLLPPSIGVSGNAMERLDQMIGLQDIKAQVRRVIATANLEKTRGNQSRSINRNLTFAGSPGTGKSETARIYADILRENGICSGTFREVGREGLVGQYVGETSLKVEKLFSEVRGGVLFIDEAGALLSDGRDTFAKECIDAIVRHMELHPETVVIFATYQEDMEQLLSSNDGLRSRFSRNFVFPDYSAEELWLILKNIAARDHYDVPEDAYEICTEFFTEQRRRKGKDFGNGREARRLLEHAIEELAVRFAEDATSLTLIAEDFRIAAGELLGPAPAPTKHPIGFRAS